VRLYHFTSVLHWPRIANSGVLAGGEANLDMFRANVGPAVIWLLDTPTVDFPHGLEGSIVDKTRIRFTIDTSLAIKWTDWRDAALMEPSWRQALIDTAGGESAADHWYVLPTPGLREKRWVEVRDMHEDVVLWLPDEVA